MKQLEKITNSYELFTLINEHRVMAGKAPMKYHRDLVVKMKDELEDWVSKKTQPINYISGKGRQDTLDAYILTREDVYLIAMRESKEVRKSIYRYIEQLEQEVQYYKDFYIARQEKLLGMNWDEACAYAGIKHANYCRMMLLNYSGKPFTYFTKNSSGGYYVTEEGVATGYFYNRGNKFTKNTTMKISKEGRDWLKRNRDWFNTQTDLYIEKMKAAA